MSWFRIFEKVIFWVLYVCPYFFFFLIFLVSTENITSHYHLSLHINNVSSEINSNINEKSNIFSDSYDIFIFLLYGIGLFGIYTYLYSKEYFSKKFWIFVTILLVVDFIGKILYNLENFLITIIVLIYLIYYFVILFFLIRSYYE